MIESISIETQKQGLIEITSDVNLLIRDGRLSSGLCTILVQHTSASLTIQENADPSARYDLENWLNRLVPENDALYTHTTEGSDDMPAHIKSALTTTSLSIPFLDDKLLLGTWQGLYLWEHRHQGSRRRLVVHISS